MITFGRWVLFDTVAIEMSDRRRSALQIVTGLILSPVIHEFDVEGPFLKLAQNIGLLVGAAFWGVTSDIWGRR